MRLKDKSGESKEGSGRVALYSETGLTHLYVIEASYNTSKGSNLVAPAMIDEAAQRLGRGWSLAQLRRPLSPSRMNRNPEPFVASVLMDTGRALLISGERSRAAGARLAARIAPLQRPEPSP